MPGMLSGVRVVELASWIFVPTAGAVLAEWGADVIKIEHPDGGDPLRGLMSMGMIPGGVQGIDPLVELSNRGKRSVGLDIKTPEGYEALSKLIAQSDVFLTNVRRKARESAKIEVQDLRSLNPDLVYVRASGNGELGPDAERGAYDLATFWSRGGSADILSDGDEYPIGQPGAGYGDVISGAILAGGVSAALHHRALTGEAPVVDTSLLAMGMWATSVTVSMADVLGLGKFPKRPRGENPNPLAGYYRTSDGRYLVLQMLQSDRYWQDLVDRLGHPELGTDARFTDASARAANSHACVAALDGAFAERTLADWKVALADATGVWAPVQSAEDILQDQQAIANGYVRTMTAGSGEQFQMVPSPLQFDETLPTLHAAPKLGEHTDEVLLEIGLSMEDILERKIAGGVL